MQKTTIKYSNVQILKSNKNIFQRSIKINNGNNVIMNESLNLYTLELLLLKRLPMNKYSPDNNFKLIDFRLFSLKQWNYSTILTISLDIDNVFENKY